MDEMLPLMYLFGVLHTVALNVPCSCRFFYGHALFVSLDVPCLVYHVSRIATVSVDSSTLIFFMTNDKKGSQSNVSAHETPSSYANLIVPS